MLQLIWMNQHSLHNWTIMKPISKESGSDAEIAPSLHTSSDVDSKFGHFWKLRKQVSWIAWSLTALDDHGLDEPFSPGTSLWHRQAEHYKSEIVQTEITCQKCKCRWMSRIMQVFAIQVCQVPWSTSSVWFAKKTSQAVCCLWVEVDDPRSYRSKGSSPGKKCLKSFGPQPFGIDFQRVQPNRFKPTTKLQFPGQTN
jgi:hypothetical protein